MITYDNMKRIENLIDRVAVGTKEEVLEAVRGFEASGFHVYKHNLDIIKDGEFCGISYLNDLNTLKNKSATILTASETLELLTGMCDYFVPAPVNM